MRPGLTLRTKYPHLRGNAIVLSVRTDARKQVFCTVLTEYGFELEMEPEFLKRAYSFGPVVDLDNWMKDHYNKVTESYERYLVR